jgi:hypothetical protein
MFDWTRVLALGLALFLGGCASKPDTPKIEPLAITINAVFSAVSLSGAKNALLQACAEQGYKIVSTLGPVICAKLKLSPARVALIERNIGTQIHTQVATEATSVPSELLSFELKESGGDILIEGKSYATVPDINGRVRTLRLEDAQAADDLHKIYARAGAK